MNQVNTDIDKLAFVTTALAAAERAQRWSQIRMIVTMVAAATAAIWLASRAASPELGIECTIVIVVGAMIGAATAKIRSHLQQNTTLVLQALAAVREQPSSPRQ